MTTGLPTFTVRNLGPIAHGTVQLHPLTILVGQNNTGKTYMAQAVYAAYKALRVNGPLEPPLTPAEAYRLVSALRHPSSATAAEVFDPIEPKLQRWVRDRLSRAGDLLSRRLAIYFDVEDTDELSRWDTPEPINVSVAAQVHHNKPVTLFGLLTDPPPAPIPTAHIDIDRLRAEYDEGQIEDYLPDPDDFDDEDQDEHGRYANQLGSFLASFCWHNELLGPVGLDGDVHYLPSGRSGLLEAWTDVIRMRLELEREGLSLAGRDPAALGGIALDLLVALQRLSRSRFRRSRWRRFRKGAATDTHPYADAVTHLETLIDGSVVMSRDRERVPALSYQRGRHVIPVQRASSMVAELAPLLSWIDSFVGPGDLLLIDEPEAHMHPHAVLAVAQALVALSQAGVTVLCTTHSTEFLHQVSNCMLRRTAPDPGQDATLPGISADDLAVYRFEHDEPSGGTVIVPVEVDPNWGIPEDEYVAIAEHLSAQTERLVSHLPHLQ